MEVDKMSDFSPDMEKNNSSKLNTESADTGVKKPGLRKDKPNPAGPAEKTTQGIQCPTEYRELNKQNKKIRKSRQKR